MTIKNNRCQIRLVSAVLMLVLPVGFSDASLSAGTPATKSNHVVLLDIYREGGGRNSNPGVVVGSNVIVTARHAIVDSTAVFVNSGALGQQRIARVVKDDPDNDVLILATPECNAVPGAIPAMVGRRESLLFVMHSYTDSGEFRMTSGEFLRLDQTTDVDRLKTSIRGGSGDSGAPVFEQSSNNLIGIVTRSEDAGQGPMAQLIPADPAWNSLDCRDSVPFEQWASKVAASGGKYRALCWEALEQFKRRDYPQARKLYEQAIEIEPRREDAIEGMVWCYGQQGDPEGLAQALQRLVKSDSGNRFAWVQLGNAHMRAKQTDLAAQAYLHANEIRRSGAVCYWRCVALDRCGKKTEMFAELRKASAEFPLHTTLQRFVVERANETGDLELAIAATRRMHEANPYDGEVAFDLGWGFLQSGKREEVETILDQLTKTNPLWANRLRVAIEQTKQTK